VSVSAQAFKGVSDFEVLEDRDEDRDERLEDFSEERRLLLLLEELDRREDDEGEDFSEERRLPLLRELLPEERRLLLLLPLLLDREERLLLLRLEERLLRDEGEDSDEGRSREDDFVLLDEYRG
jgi:hypothetical protein